MACKRREYMVRFRYYRQTTGGHEYGRWKLVRACSPHDAKVKYRKTYRHLEMREIQVRRAR